MMILLINIPLYSQKNWYKTMSQVGQTLVMLYLTQCVVVELRVRWLDLIKETSSELISLPNIAK